jgi:hypothetical protein
MSKDWIKPCAWGVVLGSVLTMIVGFGWGGWATTGTVNRMAIEQTTAAVTAALVPVCIEKSKADPAGTKKLGELRALTTSYEQRDAVVKGGWASVGGGEANRDVAESCAYQLLKVAAK